MQELRTTATFTNEQPDRDALTTIVARSVLEAALAEGEPAELWFDLARADDEVNRLSIDLAPTDMEQLLGLSSEDEIAVSLDGEAIASLFDDPDVEAHGLKVPIAIVVSSAAILAPAGQAAVTQGVGAAATTQRTSPAVSAQAHTAARAEVIGTGDNEGRGHRHGNEGRGHRNGNEGRGDEDPGRCERPGSSCCARSSCASRARRGSPARPA